MPLSSSSKQSMSYTPMPERMARKRLACWVIRASIEDAAVAISFTSKVNGGSVVVVSAKVSARVNTTGVEERRFWRTEVRRHADAHPTVAIENGRIVARILHGL